jgi:ComF family protein
VFQGPLRKALHRLKYERDIGLGDPLSNHLIEYYNELKWDIDFVTVVPLSKERLRERGYNQAALLARPFAYAIHKPYLPKLLYRKRNTRTQVGLNASERRQNVNNAFGARLEKVHEKNILVIDDVTTTGSTISACAQALRQAGASAVYGLTLSRAVLQADADDQPKPSHTKWR